MTHKGQKSKVKGAPLELNNAELRQKKLLAPTSPAGPAELKSGLIFFAVNPEVGVPTYPFWGDQQAYVYPDVVLLRVV